MTKQPHPSRAACDLITVMEGDVEDPIEKMIQKTGCAKLHYALQDCMNEHQDWRKCQNLVKEFRICMENYQSERTVYNEDVKN